VYRPFRSSWLRIGLSDRVAFDLWLAQAVVIRNGLVHKSNKFAYDELFADTSEANSYYCKSLHQLTIRLNDREDCISEGVIATIMGFICVDVRFLLLLSSLLTSQSNVAQTRVDNWKRFIVHMDGLEQIYHLRHGFDALDSEIILMTFW
jgi:hypothetical protein